MAPHRKLTALLLLSACADAEVDDADELRAAAVELGDDDVEFCIEPVTEPNPAYAVPEDAGTEALLAGSLTSDGQQLDFGLHAPATWKARIAQELGPDPAALKKRGYADLTVRNKKVRIVNAWTRPQDRIVSGGIVIDIKQRGFGDVELLQELALARQSTGAVTLDLTSLAVIDHAGGPVANAGAGFDLVAPPTNCTEQALVRFGPIPWNMPEFHMPHLDSCTYSECVMVHEGWIRAHHHAWRLTQMMEILRSADSLYRGFLWGQPGLDENHEQYGFTGGDISPKYYFGDYDGDRFDAIEEAIVGLWLSIYFGGLNGHAFEFRCDDAGSSGWYGAHLSLGNIRLSADAFADSSDQFDIDQDAVTHTMIHELMHHRYVHYDGLTMLVDVMTHGHGNACVGELQTERHYGIDEIRHLATYQALDHEDCNHKFKAMRAVDAYALFAMRIGEAVRDGDLWYWPKLADPTPQPPECVGDPGCLCDSIANGPDIGPDGDGAPDEYCEDFDGETTCQLTEVNAGAIVGICTRCEDVRGPGCECDEQLECDEGFCWGADTQNGGIGRCWHDPPPSYQCLADCEALFYDPQAWCYHDNFGGARCMDSDCGPWDGDDCYALGLVCREGECEMECGYYPQGSDQIVTCQDAGYPDTFECNGYRCEVP